MFSTSMLLLILIICVFAINNGHCLGHCFDCRMIPMTTVLMSALPLLEAQQGAAGRKGRHPPARPLQLTSG